MANPAGETDHLVSDLSTVLTDGFKFGYNEIVRGKSLIESYAYSGRPDAPNPFLSIDGIGCIGLPFSEFDAKRIIGSASRAHVGQDNSTVIGRGTWQIDPSLVKFENPEWEDFIHENLSQICSTLGVPGDGYGVQCELEYLLLDEAGSHFLHQDTRKTGGMFATMIVVLPSLYTGGEIYVTHASTTEVLDVSGLSAASMAVLAWYNNAVHETKPVTSGCRVVLSYNLIRTMSSGHQIMPVASNITAVSRLRKILGRWRSGDYRWSTKQNIIAYILRHTYSQSDLDKGAAALSGEDALKVSQIRTAVEELGFRIWLSSYKRYLCGDSDKSAIRTGRLPMGYIHEDESTLEYLVDLEGNKVLGDTIIHDFDVAGVVEGGHFDICCPDTTDFTPHHDWHMPATVKYRYYRTALVLFHESNMDRVMIITHGMQYGLDKLATSVTENTPTAEDKKIADLLLQYYSRMSEDIWKKMADYPLLWNDIDLWKKIIGNCPQPLLDIGMDRMLLAWKKFGFEKVRSSYDMTLRGMSLLDERIDFIRSIKMQAGHFGEREAVENWYREQIAVAVRHHTMQGDIAETAILLSIAREDGLELLRDFEAKNQPHGLLRNFLKSFALERDTILSTPANQSPSRLMAEGIPQSLSPAQIMDDLVTTCLRVLICPFQFSFICDGKMHLRESRIKHKSEIDRFVESAELCIMTKRLDQCDALLQFLWDVKGDALDKLMLCCLPIIYRLRKRLEEIAMSLVSIPSISQLTRNAIGYYLYRMLGSRTHNPRPPLRKLDCRDCHTCAPLVEFLEHVYTPRQAFRLTRKTRRHFILSLARSSDLFSYLEVQPCIIQVTKRPGVTEPYRWEHRLREAKSVLAAVGNDGIIEWVMGDQYGDVEAALAGIKAFEYIGPFRKRTENVFNYHMYHG